MCALTYTPPPCTMERRASPNTADKFAEGLKSLFTPDECLALELPLPVRALPHERFREGETCGMYCTDTLIPTRVFQSTSLPGLWVCARCRAEEMSHTSESD